MSFSFRTWFSCKGTILPSSTVESWISFSSISNCLAASSWKHVGKTWAMYKTIPSKQLTKGLLQISTLARMFPEVFSCKSLASSSSSVCFFNAIVRRFSIDSFSLLKFWSSFDTSFNVFSKSLDFSCASRTSLYFFADVSETLARTSSI